jgi:hypothetical protein
VQRQYVEAFTSLLAVLMSRDLQNGHASGATVAGADWGEVYTYCQSRQCVPRCLSQTEHMNTATKPSDSRAQVLLP